MLALGKPVWWEKTRLTSSEVQVWYWSSKALTSPLMCPEMHAMAKMAKSCQSLANMLWQSKALDISELHSRRQKWGGPVANI